ncbi:MAG: glycosyltransferase family 4 protein [Caldilineaceae bacterium]
MHCLIVSCVFPPEPVVSAQTSSQIAEGLVELGHKVTVLAPLPNRPAGQLYPGFKRRLYTSEKTDKGIRVIRCFSLFSHSSTMISRMQENVSFGLTSSGALLFLTPKPDVIYANTWPLIALGLIFLVAKVRRIPIVISVQDVYPESLLVQNRFNPSHWLIRFMRWWDALIARHSSALIVISKQLAELYKRTRHVSNERLHVVYNWGTASTTASPYEIEKFRAAQGVLALQRLGVYGGNVALAAGVDTLVNAFRYLDDTANFSLLIAGEGAQLEECKAVAADLSTNRILFHHPYQLTENAMVLGAADILLLPTRGQQSLTAVPSKLIAYLLSARPVIALAVAESDLAELLKASGAGWVVEPDRPDLLAAMIKEVLSKEHRELQSKGAAGREFALQNLTEKACLPRVLSIIEQVATKRSISAL